jgi:hypothetical protein
VNTFDIINALFESFGAYLAWVNFFKLRRDLEIKGVYWPMWVFFSVWGLWNIVFYPAVGAWASAIMGAVLCAGNIAWSVQAAILHFDGDFESLGDVNVRAFAAHLVATRAEDTTGPYIQPKQRPSFGTDTTEIDHDAVMREIYKFPQRDELIAKIEHERNKFRAVDLVKDEDGVYCEDEVTGVWLNDGDLVEVKS